MSSLWSAPSLFVLLSSIVSSGIVSGCAPAAEAGNTGAASAIEGRDELFTSVEPVTDLAIAAPRAALFVRKEEGTRDGTEVEATILAPSLGVDAPVPILLKVRGNTSLLATECSFPKLSFKFKNRADADASAFRGLRRVKIATHCGELLPSERTPYGRVANEVAPHREAFVHHVLRTVGVEAPRARPVTVRWTDTSDPSRPSLVRKAALIEDVDDVAARLGAKEAVVVESELDVDAEDAASAAKMNLDEVVRVHFAEALVGNDDWRLNLEPEARWWGPEFREPLSPFWNMKAIRFPDGRERPIPVDFDLSRITAPVAGPAPLPEHWFGGDQAARAQFALLMRDRQRFSRAQLDTIRREFLAKKPAILETLSTRWLDAEAKDAVKRLFEGFFTIIEKDEVFYSPVVASALELLKGDGAPDDTCYANTIPAGTPIVRHGVKNAALGIEQVSVLDIAWQLPCNQGRVWVRSDELTVTNRFPED